jgi:uncharacterized protein (TIGR00661 family)
MHWDPFGAPLLPPLIDVASSPVSPVPGKVLVYLPFENQSRVIELLRPIEGFDFYIYAPDNAHSDEASLHLRPTSLSGFRADLHDSCAVLCNAGFELGSECLALGKRLLVKPQGRQMEQASNALALQLLGYGDVLEQLDGAAIARWLRGGGGGRKLDFPDVADALARWLLAGDYSGASRNELSERLWRQVRVDGRPLRSPPTLSSILESAL